MRPQLNASEFHASKIYSGMSEESKVIAYDYLVRGLPLKAISELNHCSPQNVHAIAKRFLTTYQKYQEAKKREFS